MGELISTPPKTKQKVQARNEWSNILPKSWQARKKPPQQQLEESFEAWQEGVLMTHCTPPLGNRSRRLNNQRLNQWTGRNVTLLDEHLMSFQSQYWRSRGERITLGTDHIISHSGGADLINISWRKNANKGNNRCWDLGHLEKGHQVHRHAAAKSPTTGCTCLAENVVHWKRC